jgi:hypothetical protein
MKRGRVKYGIGIRATATQLATCTITGTGSVTSHKAKLNISFSRPLKGLAPIR